MSELSAGDPVGDRFVVDRHLGSGGLADVYLVRHTLLGSLHAVKVLTWRRAELAARMLNEGRIQAQLRHPNVVAVTDILHIDGQVALVMEYVEGMTLADLAAKGPLPVPDALELFAQVLGALLAAHDLGVTHRDLKPANVLLTRASTGWVAKVADFGIAKIHADAMGATLTGAAMGTPGYIAPEQIEGIADIDVRADVFALGVILYELIAGERAFGDMPVLTATLTSPPVALCDRVAGVSQALSDTLQSAMAAERDERIPDCEALAEALYPPEHPLRTTERVGPTALSIETRRPLAGTFGTTSSASVAQPTLAPVASSAVSSEPATVLRVSAPPTTDSGRSATSAWSLLGLGASVGGVGALALLAVGAGLGLAWVFRSIEPQEVVEIAQPAPEAVAPAVAEPGPDTPEPAPSSMDEVPDPLPDRPAPVAAAGPTPAAAVGAAPAAPDTEPDASVEPDPGIEAPSVDPEPDPAVEPEPDDDGVVEVTAPPEPDPPTAAPSPPAPAPPAPALAAPAVDLAGQWTGMANGRPLQLRILDATPGAVRAEVEFFAGTTSRTTTLTGTFDAETGALLLNAPSDGLTLRGQLTGTTSLSGTYNRGKRNFPWTASR